MALVRIGTVPAAPKKKLRFGLAQKLGTEVKSSFQRIGSSVSTKVQTGVQTGLQKLETRAQSGIQALEGRAQEALGEPDGAALNGPVDQLAPDASAEEALAAGYDQLAGLVDHVDVLTRAGRIHEARALVGALDTILKITKTTTVEADRSPPRGPGPMAAAPAFLPTPADEGLLVAPSAAGALDADSGDYGGEFYGGESNAYNRFPGTVGPPQSIEPLFARPDGPKRIGVTPAFGPDAGLLALPRRVPARPHVEVIPEVMRRPGGGIRMIPGRSVPPFSWRK